MDRKGVKGEITLKILEALGNTAVSMLDLMGVFLTAGYGASLGKFRYELEKRERTRARESAKKIKKKEQEEAKKQMEQRFYSFIYKLERGGLIEKNADARKKMFRVTPEGKMKLKLLKERERRIKFFPNPTYQQEKVNKFTLVIFDIPEAERRKRAWLRSALLNLGFEMAQKSVWIGKVKIPRIFIDDLRRLNIVSFVEIFEISKSGTLQKVV